MLGVYPELVEDAHQTVKGTEHDDRFLALSLYVLYGAPDLSDPMNADENKMSKTPFHKVANDLRRRIKSHDRPSCPGSPDRIIQ